MGRGSSKAGGTTKANVSPLAPPVRIQRYGDGRIKINLENKEIYEAAKNGDVSISLALNNRAGQISKFFGYDDNRMIQYEANRFGQMITDIRKGNFSKAQNIADDMMKELHTPKMPETLKQMIKPKKKG